MNLTQKSLLDRARRGDRVALTELLQVHDPALSAAAAYLAPDGQFHAPVLRTWRAALDGANREADTWPGGDDTTVRTWLVSRLVLECASTDPPAPPPPTEPEGTFFDVDVPGQDHRWKGFLASDVREWDSDHLPLGRVATRAFLADAIAELPPTPRAVLVVRDLAGVPLDAVAGVLGLENAGDAVLHLRWARAEVQRCLGQYLEGDVDDGAP